MFSTVTGPFRRSVIYLFVVSGERHKALKDRGFDFKVLPWLQVEAASGEAGFVLLPPTKDADIERYIDLIDDGYFDTLTQVPKVDSEELTDLTKIAHPMCLPHKRLVAVLLQVVSDYAELLSNKTDTCGLCAGLGRLTSLGGPDLLCGECLGLGMIGDKRGD